MIQQPLLLQITKYSNDWQVFLEQNVKYLMHFLKKHICGAKG